jgi:hypothetical protein
MTPTAPPMIPPKVELQSTLAPPYSMDQMLLVRGLHEVAIVLIIDDSHVDSPREGSVLRGRPDVYLGLRAVFFDDGAAHESGGDRYGDLGLFEDEVLGAKTRVEVAPQEAAQCSGEDRYGDAGAARPKQALRRAQLHGEEGHETRRAGAEREIDHCSKAADDTRDGGALSYSGVFPARRSEKGALARLAMVAAVVVTVVVADMPTVMPVVADMPVAPVIEGAEQIDDGYADAKNGKSYIDSL